MCQFLFNSIKKQKKKKEEAILHVFVFYMKVFKFNRIIPIVVNTVIEYNNAPENVHWYVG